jgi:hypothetical protein
LLTEVKIFVPIPNVGECYQSACRKNTSPPQATPKNVARNDMIASQL